MNHTQLQTSPPETNQHNGIYAYTPFYYSCNCLSYLNIVDVVLVQIFDSFEVNVVDFISRFKYAYHPLGLNEKKHKESSIFQCLMLKE